MSPFLVAINFYDASADAAPSQASYVTLLGALSIFAFFTKNNGFVFIYMLQSRILLNLSNELFYLVRLFRAMRRSIPDRVHQTTQGAGADCL
ncbi:hypothetical protein [Viridibacterium curvum]|uniref:hypothetical protein n=1 Tax=Viridibacterium curvum TaxID=1101404 RepID=UPI0031E4F811